MANRISRATALLAAGSIVATSGCCVSHRKDQVLRTPSGEETAVFQPHDSHRE